MASRARWRSAGRIFRPRCASANRRNEKGVDAIRKDHPTEQIKVLTSCPACLQGLSRYDNDTGTSADYIVIEMAKDSRR